MGGLFTSPSAWRRTSQNFLQEKDKWTLMKAVQWKETGRHWGRNGLEKLLKDLIVDLGTRDSQRLVMQFGKHRCNCWPVIIPSDKLRSMLVINVKRRELPSILSPITPSVCVRAYTGMHTHLYVCTWKPEDSFRHHPRCLSLAVCTTEFLTGL